jgi:hypothetical protein
MSPGSKVKIKGNPEGNWLVDCSIVETGPNPAIVISAHQLAKEFLENPDKAKGTYRDKWLIVEGFYSRKNPTVQAVQSRLR